MKLLLDTHALIWWMLGSDRISAAAVAAIDDKDAQVLVSAVTAFEISLKYRLGKLPEVADLVLSFDRRMADQRFEPLAVTIEHARTAGMLDIPHKDPFDRLLIAQAQVEGAWLVSNEAVFDGYGVRRLW